jgi:hypothetical protein
MSTVKLHRYESPVEPAAESGVHRVAEKTNPHEADLFPDAATEAKRALYEAICILARAAGRLSHATEGGAR